MRSLNLPAALNESEQRSNIPSSILAMSREVRNEGGLARLNAMFDTLQDKSKMIYQTLDEVNLTRILSLILCLEFLFTK